MNIINLILTVGLFGIGLYVLLTIFQFGLMIIIGLVVGIGAGVKALFNWITNLAK